MAYFPSHFPFVSGQPPVEIREVSVEAGNLEAEFDAMCRHIAAASFPDVAIATKSFPGNLRVISFPSPQNCYEFIRDTVDNSDLQQFGLAATGPHHRIAAWQFNFRWYPSAFHLYPPPATANADLNLAVQRAHFALRFAQRLEELLNSDQNRNSRVSWVTFKCPYDVAYLLKCLVVAGGSCLPRTFQTFRSTCTLFFPRLFDLKVLARYCAARQLSYTDLDELADQLEVEHGRFPTAGFDALQTLQCYLKLRDEDPRFREAQESYKGM